MSDDVKPLTPAERAGREARLQETLTDILEEHGAAAGVFVAVFPRGPNNMADIHAVYDGTGDPAALLEQVAQAFHHFDRGGQEGPVN